MDAVTKSRLNWVKLFLESNDAGYVCRRCGISRPTLRKWVKRYEDNGLKGLEDKIRRPHSSPGIKITSKIENLVLSMRSERNLGARRIQSELIRLHEIRLSLATIHKVLKKHEVKPIKKMRRKKDFKRYQRPIPGDRVQIDTCKIRPGIYQFTAVDDCTRFRVLDIYKRRTANNTLEFIDKMIEEFPFPIQRIQSDRGREFFAEKVQQKMMEYCIKFRPVKPASPHLNGKVERSQKTDLEEFYAMTELGDFDLLREKLAEWQFFYNWVRPHSALKGKTPSQVDSELVDKTPFQEDVVLQYDETKEHVQNPVYAHELAIRQLKGCP